MLGADVFFMMVAPKTQGSAMKSGHANGRIGRCDPPLRPCVRILVRNPCRSYFRRGLGSRFPGPWSAKHSRMEKRLV